MSVANQVNSFFIQFFRLSIVIAFAEICFIYAQNDFYRNNNRQAWSISPSARCK